MLNRPGGAIARQPLQLIFILDVSGSMGVKGKIDALNKAIRETIPAVRDAAETNPHVNVLVRALTFGDEVEWHIDPPLPVEQLDWVDVKSGGETKMGAALRTVAVELGEPPMPSRSRPPVLVLISDGRPTDDFHGGMAALLSQRWGKAAIRLAVAIGSDADEGPLNAFIADPKVKLLRAHRPAELTKHIVWVSTAGVAFASDVSTQSGSSWIDVADDAAPSGEDIW